MTAKGVISDSDTNQPLDAATVELWYNNVKLASVAAGSDGRFNLYTNAGVPNLIKITSAEYKPYSSPFTAADDNIEYGYKMVRNVKELDPVVIVSTFVKKNPGLSIALLFGALLLISEKK
jgi:hypothetical protein